MPFSKATRWSKSPSRRANASRAAYRLWLIWAGSTLLAAWASPEPRYIGGDRCKLCHRDVYDSWQRTAHARAQVVTAESPARCRRCHATGDRPPLPGVQCEACHGPGEDYWPAEVMIDPDKAAMAGLLRPGETLCRRCHDNDEPEHRRAFVMPSGRDFAASVHVRRDP